jgi:geranylgeranyl pyrophosphate synthase
MAAAEAVGAPPQAALPMATAVELVHTYSLIHDDLPCMDDDVVRRGRPTVHVSYDEAVAVLAGDALQALAFESLTADLSDPARVAAAVCDLALAIGAQGLVGGQVDDLAFGAAGPGAAVGPGEGRIAAIESIHARKTAALIAVSIVGGARFGGADDECLEVLDGFGRAIGVAYQITDDLLDADEDDGCTLVREIGVEACRERAESLLVGALDAVEGMGERAEPLRELARHGVRREG